MNAKSTTNLRLMKRQGLPEELASIIMRRIEGGDFKLGDILPSEKVLAEIYQVSRTVVREALARLKYEGIIQSKRGSGPVVRSTSPTKGFDLGLENDSATRQASFLEFRLLLESEAAAMAALRHTAEQARRLRQYLEQMQEAINQNTSGADPDYRFHCLIAEASGNEYVNMFTSQLSIKIWARVYSARGLSNKIRVRAHEVHGEHTNIYDAIAARNPDKARLAAMTHLLASAGRQNVQLDTRHLQGETLELLRA